jgi:hypothetical protein
MSEEDWPIPEVDDSQYDTEPEEPIQEDDCEGCKI